MTNSDAKMGGGFRLRGIFDRSRAGSHKPPHILQRNDVIWAMGSFCALNRKPFDAELLLKQFPPPYTSDSLIHAARALGFRIKRQDCNSAAVAKLNLPCLVLLNEAVAVVQAASHEDNQLAVSQQAASPLAAKEQSAEVTASQQAGDATPSDSASLPEAPPLPQVHPAIVVQANADNMILFEVGTNTPRTMTHAEFAVRYAGSAFQLALETKGIKDPDGAMTKQVEFGFRWFIPELMKHKRVWRDVLIA